MCVWRSCAAVGRRFHIIFIIVSIQLGGVWAVVNRFISNIRTIQPVTVITNCLHGYTIWIESWRLKVDVFAIQFPNDKHILEFAVEMLLLLPFNKRNAVSSMFVNKHATYLWIKLKYTLKKTKMHEKNTKKILSRWTQN